MKLRRRTQATKDETDEECLIEEKGDRPPSKVWHPLPLSWSIWNIPWDPSNGVETGQRDMESLENWLQDSDSQPDVLFRTWTHRRREYYRWISSSKKRTQPMSARRSLFIEWVALHSETIFYHVFIADKTTVVDKYIWQKIK